MEGIHEYLRSYLGDRKIPLAYVVRKDENVPAGDPVAGYATVQDAMIARAKHYTIAEECLILSTSITAKRFMKSSRR